MGKQNKSYQQTDKEAFETQIREVYDNLDKEQFNRLMDSSGEKLRHLIKSKEAEKVKTNDGNSFDYVFKDRLHTLAYNVFCTVFNSRKISFKQFKLLSAFAKVNWLQEEYKQF